MNRLSEEKAQAIATEYATNGFKKVMALLSVGYSHNYANHVGLKLFDNDKVKTALARIKAMTVSKTGFTLADAQRMYEEDRDFARSCRQSGAAVTATTGICRLYGMDKDAGGGEKTVIIISPKAPKVIESTVVSPQEADTDDKE
ncbi:hypothetical protein LCGC14_1891480 [marine sediment metagenome]|uniref:Uncharacterized protein n=1 Tax=marine sediment metagenome TaxID=412755 RepID=A0A0F9FZN2_9ZZZZ